MRNRRMSLLLAAVIAAQALAGCGGGNQGTAEQNTQKTESSSVAAKAQEKGGDIRRIRRKNRAQMGCLVCGYPALLEAHR